MDLFVPDLDMTIAGVRISHPDLKPATNAGFLTTVAPSAGGTFTYVVGVGALSGSDHEPAHGADLGP